MNIDIDLSIGNQKTMGGINTTDERSMGNSDTTGRPGITLGHVDQYELVRELGGGGFGVVYLARDTVSGIDVAVKGLPPVVKNNAEEIEQIRRNFALVSRLHHPNIAAALVLHRARDVHYEHEQVRQSLRVLSSDTLMVMTYAPGVTLSKWRKQFSEGRVPVKQALDVCQQIASALDYAHAEKVVHRDIKPANVMIETRRTMSEGGKGSSEAARMRLSVKVLDFGLAAEIRSSMNRVSQEKGDTSGTRPYMAPEQWAGKKQDGKTDQYALAVLFYELVSGEVPFTGAFETGDPAVMMAVVERNIPEMLPALSASQNAVLRRALSKNPTQRYESCSAFAEALSGMQASVEHSVKALGENGENIVKAVQTYNKAVSWVGSLRLPHYLKVGREFLVALLGVVPPVSRFVDRVLGVLLEPKQSWTSVKAERGTIGQLCKRYVFVLVAISLFPSVISAFHSSRYSSGYWMLSPLLLAVVWRYLLTLGGLYLSARLISELAPQFGAPKARENAYKLVVFSLCPVFLCTFFYYMFTFPLPYWLVWGYAAFLLHWGLKALMGVEKKKLFVYTAISFIILVALYGSLGYLSKKSERNLSAWAQQIRYSWEHPQTASDESRTDSDTKIQPPPIPCPPIIPPIPRPPVVYNTPGVSYFEPSDFDPESAIPPMNLPDDIWLSPSARCKLIQREFPAGSPTNTLVVFGLRSQSELNMFCEKMKTNGWRITTIGHLNSQHPGMMASGGFSASFAKARKTATLTQRRDTSFELVVCGPEDESVPPVKSVPVPPPVNNVKEQPATAKIICINKDGEMEEAAKAAKKIADDRSNQLKIEKEKELEAKRLKDEEEARKKEAAATEAETLRRAEVERQEAEARRLAEVTRATQITNGLFMAKQMVEQEQWTNLLAQANALLELDPENGNAKQYKDWAGYYLNTPILKLIAMVNGKEVNTQVKIDNDVNLSPVKLVMDKAQYSVEIFYTEGDKKYEAKELLAINPDWKGVKPKTITLREVKKVPAALAVPISAPSKPELPAHPVEGQQWVSPSTGMVFVWVDALKIWVGKYEVTNEEYRRKVSTHSSRRLHGSDKRDYSLDGDRQPVVFVNFNEAAAYSAWLSQADAEKLQQYQYRLPTMKEFTSYIQCGVFLRTYPWGEKWPPPVGQAGNYDDEKVISPSSIENYSDGSVVTCAVENSGKNAWGLFGVGGNVWECCTENFSSSEFGGWRGGSWADSSEGDLKCEFKSGAAGAVRNEYSGFRLVLSR